MVCYRQSWNKTSIYRFTTAESPASAQAEYGSGTLFSHQVVLRPDLPVFCVPLGRVGYVH